MDEKQISGLPCILILSLIIRKKNIRYHWASHHFVPQQIQPEWRHYCSNKSIIDYQLQHPVQTTDAQTSCVSVLRLQDLTACDNAAEAHDTAEELVLNVLWAILVAMTKLKSRINSFCNCHVKCSENIGNNIWQPILLPRLVVMELMWWVAWHESKIIASLQCIKVGGIGDTTLSHVRRWTYVDEMPLCNSEMDVHNLWELDWILYGNMRNTYVH